MSQNSPENSWHLDKRVPLALIFTIFIQTIGVVAFILNMDNEIQRNKENIVEIKVTTDKHEEELKELREMKIHMQYMNNTLKWIEDFLKHGVVWEDTKTSGGNDA